MIRSMTGFGRGTVSRGDLQVVVEARSVNHRFLDVAIRLPSGLAELEGEVRRLVQAVCDRGRVEVTVELVHPRRRASAGIVVDEGLARQYLDAAESLGRRLGLGGTPSATWLFERPGVVRSEEVPSPDTESAREVAEVTAKGLVREAVAAALDELSGLRAAEGAALRDELRALHGALAVQAEAMTERAPVSAARRGERLRERLAQLLGDRGVDEARIVTEVAVWAQRSDITEELARIRAHLGELETLLDKDAAIGRALDFRIQELHREVNTVASKADDLDLSQAALAAKALLEKIREQAQNVE